MKFRITFVPRTDRTGGDLETSDRVSSVSDV